MGFPIIIIIASLSVASTMWWLGMDIGIVGLVVALIGIWLDERSSKSTDKGLEDINTEHKKQGKTLEKQDETLEIIRKNQEEVSDQMKVLARKYDEAATNKAKEDKITTTELYNNIGKVENVNITNYIVDRRPRSDK